MQFTDAVTVAGTRRRDDGYLVADARIARTGVQLYRGDEVGRDDMATVCVYRPGAEVFLGSHASQRCASADDDERGWNCQHMPQPLAYASFIVYRR